MKLCKDCKHAKDRTFLRHDSGFFCFRQTGISPVDGEPEYLRVLASTERKKGECGMDAKYFEEKE